jgi:hypothetical protein
MLVLLSVVWASDLDQFELGLGWAVLRLNGNAGSQCMAEFNSRVRVGGSSEDADNQRTGLQAGLLILNDNTNGW